MGTTTQERIGRWLGELLAAAVMDEGVVFSLVHINVNQAQRLVRIWKPIMAAPNEEEFTQLVNEIETTAGEDADELGGMQRYLVRASARGRDVGTLMVRFSHPENAVSTTADSESATSMGVIAMLQRHLEGATRMNHQSIGMLLQSYQRRLTQQDQVIAQFEARYLEGIQLREQLATKQFERDMVLQDHQHRLEIEAVREKHNHAAKQQAIQTVLGAVPPLLYHLTAGKTGSPALNASAGPATETPQPPDGALNDDQLQTVAREFYGALMKRKSGLASVIGALSAKTEWEGLGPETREMFLVVMRDTNLGKDGESATLWARAFWLTLVHSGTGLLAPVALALTAGTAWADLDETSRTTLLAVVQTASGLVSVAAQAG